ncbi:MAG: DJ-1/PfpI family protein [Eubacteriales bacterium]|nr:DJ-1/PfpI family protein [Eubacteriales bacterium]MDD4324379.1 DJ-1/PfpI family protein [Eubacteriales bacterium]MDD4541450.1 DJ-1/PfpI family protein [Eubacteriales bacterium]
MRKRVLILLAEGFEAVEALTPANYLRRAAIEVTLCSCQESELTVASATDIRVVCDIEVNQARVEDYDMLLIPGGDTGYKNLLENELVLKLIREFDAAGKWIGAICAGPLVLKEAGVLAGKRHTSYPDLRAEFDPEFYSEDLVVFDGRLITSRGPTPAVEFSFALIAALMPERVVNLLKEKTLYDLTLDWLRR